MPPPPDDTPLMQDVFAEMGPELVAEANARMEGRGMPGLRQLGGGDRGLPASPRRGVVASPLGARHPGPGGCAVRRDPRRRAGARQPLRRRASMTPRSGRITVPGLPLTLDPPTDVRGAGTAAGADDGRRCSPSGRSCRRVRRRCGPDAVPARRAQGPRLRQLPRRSARPDADGRPRGDGGQGRGDHRRPDALGRLAVRRLPARQAGDRPRPEVAGQPAGGRGAGAVGRRGAPQPPPARGAPARPRRRVGAGDQPRRRLLPRQLVRAAGRPRRLARDTTSCSRPAAAGR